VADAKRFETQFLEFMDATHPDIGSTIRSSGELSDETEEALRRAVQEFKSSFAPSGSPPPPKDEEAEALESEEQESVKRYRPPPPAQNA
jgi:F-type H+-transporting ATPase subunit alpha